jgi:hypothetical protein
MKWIVLSWLVLNIGVMACRIYYGWLAHGKLYGCRPVWLTKPAPSGAEGKDEV